MPRTETEEKVLITGNVAAAEGAVRGGCRFYFGYPITPQNDLPEYMSARMPEVDGVFIQAESELAAVSLVHGAAAAGGRAMTSSSSPGISLKQEGLSYLAGSELPAFIVNVQRGGPGLGDVRCAQGDYFQATRGGGHGDYRLIVLAPHTVQETMDLAYEAFDLAEKWRCPVLLLSDQQLGQMMEPVVLPPMRNLPKVQDHPWALTGAAGGRERRIVKSFYWRHGELEEFNKRLREKYLRMEKELVRWEEDRTEDADIVLVAYGTSARIARDAVRHARAEGVKAGLVRPITLWPFPAEPLVAAAGRGARFLVVEMSWGQMVEDVKLALYGTPRPVDLFWKSGGGVPGVGEVTQRVLEVMRQGGPGTKGRRDKGT
ncbi:MAG: 3-methyl-2-oxobutanoate dehydrogenase subunit VorB [Phycisphaerae bacterium]|nr:3-methyl-2-oxobutanoate dehydrogenase subunit VorB [Phycisphaerae bacterium]